MAHSSYTIFLWDQVILRPDPKFVRKISLSFHINQAIHLPEFSPKPPESAHTLDVRCTLVFYLDRTKLLRKSQRFFVSTMGNALRDPPSPHIGYQNGYQDALTSATNNPHRDQNSFYQICIKFSSLSERCTTPKHIESCHLASEYMYTKHCAITQSSGLYALLGLAVLFSLSQTTPKPLPPKVGHCSTVT